jgi:glucose-6-phosphate isomerase
MSITFIYYLFLIIFMINLETNYSPFRKSVPNIKINIPLFAQYSPDFDSIERIAKKYTSKKNIIVIGNGGSITSFHYFASALGTEKNIHILSTMEPDFLADIKNRCKKNNTAIIAVSKSGTTVGVIEALLYFIDYPSIIVVTENKKSALKEIQELYGFDFIEHPPIGGRYSGFTPSGLLPSAIAGLNIRDIWDGAEKAYKKYSPHVTKNNTALDLAHFLYSCEKKGYNEIFMPIYSSRLLSSKDIITQLIHESCGKEGKGQTLLAAFAPESQHHTNQRFFGGSRNMLGCFVVVDELENKYDIIKIPQKIRNIPLRDGTIGDISNNFYHQSLNYEYIGTKEDAVSNKIPNVTIHVKKITPFTAGMYLAFWHYVTVYLCKLSSVDPFNQPQVESSKEISFSLRKKNNNKHK